MVDLPLEIIHRIITISFPRSLVDYHSRRRFLLPLCSLHSSLRRFVQRLLFVHPVFYGPDSAALFLDTVEGNQSGFDFGGCVKSLRMYGPWDEATVGDTDRLISRLVESCDAIEEIWIHSLENVNFARFAKLSKLRSLHCEEADYATFEPNEGFDSFPSLVDLALHGGTLTALVEAHFLTSAVLPSLRLFYASEVRLDGGLSLTHPSPLYAAPLHHLSLDNADQEIVPLLRSTRRLRSLDLGYSDPLEFPPNFRFATPLIAIRMWACYDRDSVNFTIGDLETMLAVGLFDSRTVVFLPLMEESDAAGVDLKEWGRSHGMRLEWDDGELGGGWSEVDSGYPVHRVSTDAGYFPSSWDDVGNRSKDYSETHSDHRLYSSALRPRSPPHYHPPEHSTPLLPAKPPPFPRAYPRFQSASSRRLLASVHSFPSRLSSSTLLLLPSPSSTKTASTPDSQFAIDSTAITPASFSPSTDLGRPNRGAAVGRIDSSGRGSAERGKEALSRGRT